MCGIAGLVSRSQIDLMPLAKKMAGALEHRGPDDQKVWIGDNNVALVHTRLAIQDLSPNGQQPMSSTSNRFVIAFNGEIYNFKKIRSQLQSSGKTFFGGSDTEVMLSAIEEYGLENALKMFEGMFAFSLWDKEQKKLYLCRDRLGEKPLFYAWSEGNFFWASELKALKKLPFWKPEINKQILASYLKYGYVPSPNSIYKDCFKLVPGTILEIPFDSIFDKDLFSPYSDTNDSKISPKPYWNISQIIQPSNRLLELSQHQATEKLDEILNGVIADQMISDVPYGAFLSGGIDSSLVTSIMQSQSSKPIDTFTIGFNEKDFNEAEFAKQISLHLGTNHHEQFISSNDCLNLVPELPTIMDEPFADSSVLPSYFVSALAKEKVTVCLSGDGGDELFGGYNRYTYTEAIWKKINFYPLPVRKIIGQIIFLFPYHLYETIYNLITRFFGTVNRNTRVGLKVQKLAKLLQLNSLNEIYEMLICYCQSSDNIWSTDQASHLLLSDNRAESLNSDDNFIERAMAIDTLTYLPDDNLTKVDRTSMMSSLETRLPLLNHNVVEFAWKLPLGIKTNKQQSKKILRDVLYKRVPRELIERPKMGFSVPISEWLRGPLKDWGESLLLNQKNLEHGLFNSKSIDFLWNQHQTGKNDHSAPLWSLLMFQAWYISTHD